MSTGVSSRTIPTVGLLTASMTGTRDVVVITTSIAKIAKGSKMTEWVCPRCGHDHTEPPWRAGDEDICNLTMGALICGCTYLRRGPPPPPRLTRAEIEEIFDSFGAPKPPRNREVS